MQVKHYPEHKPFCLLHVKDLAQWDGAVMSNPADSAMKEDLRRLQDVFTDEFLHYGRSALKLGHPGACAHTHLLRVSFGYFSSGTELPNALHPGRGDGRQFRRLPQGGGECTARSSRKDAAVATTGRSAREAEEADGSLQGDEHHRRGSRGGHEDDEFTPDS